MFFILRGTKNHLLLQELEELLWRGFLTRVKLSPDCPLVEVLKEPRNDRQNFTNLVLQVERESSVFDGCPLFFLANLPYVNNFGFLKKYGIARHAPD